MNEQEIKQAISSLLTLWRDVEWWEEQGFHQIRPTLKAAADAARQLKSERDEAREQVERLTVARDEWRKTAYQITEQANKTRDNLTEERDIAKADFEKVVGYNTRLQDELDKARAEVERLTRELEQAISERTPHDYGIIKEQRDHYRDRLCAAIKETQEARAEMERLKNHLPDATKMIRPEPSRLEIAAMLQAGWLANPESEIDNQHDWWLAQADALIEAAKGGAK
jgi:chromosome segregation ATPase